MNRACSTCKTTTLSQVSLVGRGAGSGLGVGRKGLAGAHLVTEGDDRHEEGLQEGVAYSAPQGVLMKGPSRAPMRLPLLVLSHPPRSSLSTRVTRHWWEGRPSRYSGCKGDRVHPAEMTCQCTAAA